MKGKYITTQILLACKAKPAATVTVKEQKAMPDELKQLVARKIPVRTFELVAA